MGLLDGVGALVLGGGRGIGAAVSGGLGASGAHVGVLDLELDRAAAVAEEIRAGGGDALPIECDILDDEALVAAIRSVDEQLKGGLRLLVNVAGGMHAHARWLPTHEWTPEAWDAVVGLNLRYVFVACREALTLMVDRPGSSIVNIASISGLTGAPRHAAYGAAKAGLMNLTETLAIEYGRYGIRVNALAPGSILTPAVAGGTSSQASDRMAVTVPLGRRGSPSEIADGVVFLASPMASYINGHTLVVDGGVSARFPMHLPGGHVSENP